MISFKELSDIFKGMGFNENALKKFYFSVRKSAILHNLGKRSWPELFTIEEKCQWPILKKIDDPGLPIYAGADRILLDRFIGSIIKEKDLRAHKSAMHKVRYWSLLQSLIEERSELLINIFGFTEKDVERCESIAERYSNILDKKAREKKKMWHIGIGAGAATLAAGAAAIWYISKKDKT